MELLGFHHLTAISAQIRENYRFYTEVMGMRLVKRSVNQDDVSAYHLFYSDAVGTPGNDLTFFDWPIAREGRGTNSIVRTGLRVPGVSALEWWERHLEEQGVRAGGIVERNGRQVLDFEDPEGQRLTLVGDDAEGTEFAVWERSTVPSEFQVRGLGPVVLSVPSLTNTEQVLTNVLGMTEVGRYAIPDGAQPNVHVFEMGGGGLGAELHVAVQPQLPPARQGAGGVHHVAFRTPNDEEYHAWGKRLNELRIANSGEVDRFWFKSLYFREPNGILFEIATDGPGFAVDEDPATLGEKVVLPPFLEPHRERIVGRLKPIE